MKLLIIAFISILFSANVYAQKGIEKINSHKIDSLQHVNVDTIIYYQSYCGECEILGHKQSCYVLSGYTLIENVIIYQQKGKFYSLDFDCYNSSVKKQLDSCKSIPYFISILSTLNKRNKTIKAIYKKGDFLGPGTSDGGFEEAHIYFNKNKQTVSMSAAEKTRLYDVYKKYFWIDKEIHLLKLIESDIK
jgi:hypothetical protein